MPQIDPIPALEEALKLARNGDLRTLLLCYDDNRARCQAAVGDPLTIIGFCESMKTKMLAEHAALETKP